MLRRMRIGCVAASFTLFAIVVGACHNAPDPSAPALETWSDGAVKQRILAFIKNVSEPDGESYVPPEKRIAVFDLDGTLIIESPLHLEVLVAMETLRAAASADSSLEELEPYRAVIAEDYDYIRRHGADIVTAAAGGGSVSEFHRDVRTILKGVHPSLDRPYSALFYAPMLELIDLLHAHAFRVYVVSQSQQEYIRAFAESCLGVDPSRIIGSTYAYELEDGRFVRSSTVWEPYNRGEGKVLRIRERTGGLPIFAFGNGRGDRFVLEATSQAEPSLVFFLDHDDGEREFQYGSEGMLELARDQGWEVVSMKRDFAELFQGDCTLGD